MQLVRILVCLWAKVVSIKLFKKNGGYAVHPKGDVHRSLGVLAQALVTGTMSLDNGQEVCHHRQFTYIHEHAWHGGKEVAEVSH